MFEWWYSEYTILQIITIKIIIICLAFRFIFAADLVYYLLKHSNLEHLSVPARWLMTTMTVLGVSSWCDGWVRIHPSHGRPWRAPIRRTQRRSHPIWGMGTPFNAHIQSFIANPCVYSILYYNDKLLNAEIWLHAGLLRW